VGNRSFKMGWLAKGALVVGALALCAMTSAPANAASLRRAGTTGSNGNGSNGGPTGNYLFTWYAVTGDTYGNGTNIIRLVDPNGCGNNGISNNDCASEVPECAMVYVFDSDQEMEECCGCPITPNGIATIDVSSNLLANPTSPVTATDAGTIVVVGSSLNVASCPMNSPTSFIPGSCNSLGYSAPGCAPYVAAVTAGDTNLDGSITHDQKIGGTSGLTEIPLFDQGAGDPTNNAYLVAECGSISGNGSASVGYCTCPTSD
jgi:hypothetical protein